MKFDNMNNTNLTKTSKKQGRTQEEWAIPVVLLLLGTQ